MNSLPNAKPLRIVLETLLGDNPYNDDYPKDLLITFEKSPNGPFHRIFFALYGRLGNFRAEVRQLPRQWPQQPDFGGAGNCTLSVERYYESDRRRISSPDTCRAFLAVALERLKQDQKGENEP